MNRYHRGSSTNVACKTSIGSCLGAQLEVENSVSLRTIGNLDLLSSPRTASCWSTTLICPEALINLIKKSRFGDTVPVATRTLHAKRAAGGKRFHRRERRRSLGVIIRRCDQCERWCSDAKKKMPPGAMNLARYGVTLTRDRAAARNRRPSWYRPAMNSIAAAPGNWRCLRPRAGPSASRSL